MEFRKVRSVYCPLDEEAIAFVRSFPNSRGARKSLTEDQIGKLIELGISVDIRVRVDIKPLQ